MFCVLNFKKIRLVIAFVILAVIIFAMTFFSKYILELIYPMPYYNLVEKYASENNLDIYLVYSIIKAESGFDKDAVSKKGALGLMQLTPKTAIWLASEMKLQNFSESDIIIPENNIRLGCYYLSTLLKQFDNNMDNALCAYNAGRGNVSKWLLNKEYSRDGKNLYKIPYKETRDYLKKVYRIFRSYKNLYEF